jgi:transitional endoplasmic reticulum ATPase
VRRARHAAGRRADPEAIHTRGHAACRRCRSGTSIAERTERFTGADLEDLTRRAGLVALRESLEAAQVQRAHFEQAARETRPSVTPEMEREYEEMLRTLKQEGPQRQPIGFLSPR